MTIHKEGYASLAITVAFLAVLNTLGYYLIPQSWTYVHCFLYTISTAFFLIILQFFRHPKRTTPYNENHVIAPADGKVVVIEEVEETEYFKDKRIQVSIFMSPINVHVNRYPISGEIKLMKYHPGLFLVAWDPKSSTHNERTTCVVDNGKTAILLRQIAGALAKRIVFYPKVGDKVKQAEELGFIKFGSRVDVFLPLGTKINVQLNQKVRGAETVIAEI